MSFIRSALLGTVAMASLSTVAVAATPSEVLENYGDIAQAAFEDSLTTAKTLQDAVNTLVAAPTEDNLKAARRAWIAARNPYQQTEVFRFGNSIVDDWEGKVNAWPLDEGLIDYVDGAYGNESEENPFYAANIIANTKVTVAGEEIDATKITPELLSEQLQEAGEVEANVATGYHAIEFLLWGQDLNGTGKGAGNRPASDFDTANCTGGNCDRRVEYLQAATNLLITDLEEMVAAWQVDGAARKDLADKGDAAGIATILTGMGSLSYGELAGERMKLGLMLNDPEEEQDCFSDNTHMSHYNDVVGINNVFQGKYTRVDGSVVEGASLKNLLAKADSAVSTELEGKLNASMGTFTALKTRAETTESYDQMIGEGNAEGNAVIQAAIDSLIDQTASIQRAVKALKLENVAFESSDSLDNPSAVFE
ncbi:peptidase [Pseudovibrio japonicus]|uniref:Peptidase n=1 Tax=Pseudovibrio japonicus TaxID=366534 RepID=A0ABQ3E4J5_9HYPH|nr:imelysin family protein [Pseudovibrio japonicus]GHB26208.1 peptidase [Pseudovibrio japonicus]